MVNFANLIKKERERQGLTCQQLAEAADCTARAIQYLENGQRIPSIETADRILNALGIEMVLGKEKKQ